MDEIEHKKRQETIMAIIDTIQMQGLERVSPDTNANDVMLALMNIILNALQQTGKPENVDAVQAMFAELCDMVKARITPPEVQDDVMG